MTSADDRNPSGIKLTQAQIDDSNRQSYWSHAIRYGLQYYVSGRFAAASGFSPVTANLLHHAVELLLKACLAYDDSLAEIWKYGSKRSYGHELPLLWEEFKRRNPGLSTAEFDAVISELHKFENIRYPETLIKEGATIAVAIFDVAIPPTGKGVNPETVYVLNLPQVDRLMKVLFDATHGNPEVFLPDVNGERARLYYDRLAETLFAAKPSESKP